MRLGLRRWHNIPGSLRLLKVAIELVGDGEPDKELAELGEDGLPVAWRVFRPGWNESRNGVPVLFDELAAQLTMADYRDHGARIHIDLNHLSLDEESRAYDPKAYGWGRLELREDGSCWITGATWTPRGAELLANREVRYFSPAFNVDTDCRYGNEPERVISIHNGGLVATPATDQPMALVAASRRKGMNLFDTLKAMSAETRGRIMRFHRLSTSQRELPPAKLAELLKWQDASGEIDLKVLQGVVKAIPGGDPSGGLGSMLRQIRGFVAQLDKELMGEAEMPPVEETGETEPPAEMADIPPEGEKPEMMAAARDHNELRLLRREAEENRKELKKLRLEREKREADERRHLVGQLVVLRKRIPATAWANPTDPPEKLKPRGSLATCPLDELRDEIKAYGGAPQLETWAAPRPATEHVGPITSPGEFTMSEDEAKRLEHAAKQAGRELAWCTRRYKEIRAMQIKGAATDAQKRRLGRPFVADAKHPDARHGRVVLCDATGHWTPDDLRRWSTPVAPIQDFTEVSQLAMNEFDLRYAIAAATPGFNWAEQVGDIRSSGSIGDVYFPIDFSTVEYQPVTAQGPEGETPQLWWVTVRKEEFYVGKEADLRLLREPNAFEYVNTWLAGATQMAYARWDKQQLLARDILVDNPQIYVNFEKGSLTGKNFFAPDHPINPFNPETVDVNGNATFSNYDASGSPLSPITVGSDNLTAQKAAMNAVPNLNGRFLALPATHIVHPTALQEDVTNMLTVQDLILSGALTQDSGAGVGTMGTVRSPHTGQGLLSLQAPHLPGLTGPLSDWYLFSTQIKQLGFVPFVIAESAAEEVITYDEGSDFTNRTRRIRTERRLHINAVPMHPQAVRKVLAVAP